MGSSSRRLLGCAGIAAALLGCAPSVPERAQARAPAAVTPPPEAAATVEPTPPPPAVSGEDAVRELDRLAGRRPARAEIDAFIAAYPEVLTASAPPYGTAILWALEFGRDDAASALLAAGSAVPGTALGLAARGGMDGVAKELLARGASPDAGDGWGYTPLHLAAKYGHESMIVLLIAAGARPNPRATNDGFTPLHLAVIDRRLEAVRALIGAKADLEARDDDGRTPLHWGPFAYAPQAKHLYEKLGGPHGTVFVDPGPAAVIRVLLDAGAKVDAADDRGNTPLHEAAAIGSRRGVEALLAGGAKVGAKNAAGETPLAIAERRGDTDIATMLRAGR